MNKAGKPALGSTITWTHAFADGTTAERSGKLWAEASTERGGRGFGFGYEMVPNVTMAFWVIPDQPLPTDLYAAIYVGKARIRRSINYVEHEPQGPPFVSKGQLHSSDNPTSPTGAQTRDAADRARCTRRENQEPLAG